LRYQPPMFTVRCHLLGRVAPARMETQMTLTSLLAEPTFLKGGIRIVHFIGLALGLGTATFLDLMMLRFMVLAKIRRSHAEAFEFGTKVVTAGLVMLWISGLAFLAYYWAFDPEKLANPKIWAKVSVVGVLTVNAVFLHKVVLPVVEQQVSRTLFGGLSAYQRILMVVGGTTSVTSWYVPVALGAIPQFNNSLPADQLWAMFCALLIANNALAILAFFGISSVAAKRARNRAAPQHNDDAATKGSPFPA
jgi:hypothetical protein